MLEVSAKSSFSLNNMKHNQIVDIKDIKTI